MIGFGIGIADGSRVAGMSTVSEWMFSHVSRLPSASLLNSITSLTIALKLRCLIRRRSRPIVSHTPTPSGSRPHHRENFTDVNVDREIDDAQTNPLTAGPSISADLNYGRSVGLSASHT